MLQSLHSHVHLAPVERAIEERGGDTGSVQAVHLVLHERNEWAYDNSHARQKHGRELVAERFARARRHEREDVAARHHGFHDFSLEWTKGIEPEVFLKLVEHGG